MRAFLVALACALGFLVPAATASTPSLNRQIATALKTARQAEATANVALAASKRLPVAVKGDGGATGSKGLDGQNGAPGLPGQNGAAGVAGANGMNGAKGDQGTKGDAGAPGMSGVKSYGHVTINGAGTVTQGTTVTHPGLGLYCMNDQGFVAVVASPDSWNATAFALPPGDLHGSCGPAAWTVLITSNSGTDTGFYYVAN